MLNRRRFLVTSALAVGASTVPATAPAGEKKPASPSAASLRDWNAVRKQFELDRRYIHLGLFFLASHPRPVREALEDYRRRIDADPFQTVEHGLSDDPQHSLPLKVCQAIGSYIGGSADDIALTQNTTTGLALLYYGLSLTRIGHTGQGRRKDAAT